MLYTINAIMVALKETFPEVILPDEVLQEGRIRVVLAEWDSEKRAFERDAGLVWMRKQWEIRPEPTLILGIEPEHEVKKRKEGALLNIQGIAYIQLPARLNEIQAKIDQLLQTKISTLDLEASVRNTEDFVKRLRAFWHQIKNIQSSIAASIRGLKLINDDNTRRWEYEELFAKQPVDKLTKSISTFDALLSEYEGHSIVQDAKENLEAIRKNLLNSEDLYTKLTEALKLPYSFDNCNSVLLLLQQLVERINSIESLINEVTRISNQTDIHRK